MAANTGRHMWQAHEDELIKRLAAAGRTARQIAERLGGKSRNAVIGRLNRLGIITRKGSALTSVEGRIYGRRSKPSGKNRPPKVILPGHVALPTNPMNAHPHVQPVGEQPGEAQNKFTPGAWAAPPPFSRNTVDRVMALTNRHCRWPLFDIADPQFRFCCEPVEGTRPYCERHRQRAYTQKGAGNGVAG